VTEQSVWSWLTTASSWQGEDGILHRLWEHVWLSGVSVLVACLIALPSITAGVRIATVNTVALVTIGFAVGHGGLGEIITTGFTNNLYRQQVLTGVVLVVLLAVVFDLLLLLVQRLLTPWVRAEAAR